jgi:hypothetical protein
MGGNAVEMEISIDLTEMGRLNVAPSKLRIRVRKTAFHERNPTVGDLSERHLIHAPASSSGFEQKVACGVGLRVTNRNGLNRASCRVELSIRSAVLYTNMAAPEAPAPFTIGIEAW